MAKGYVYVLSNPAMPGIVKIGKSNRGGRQRAIELFDTGVPMPFNVEFEILVEDPSCTELSVHDGLDRYRVNGSREFFRCSPQEAMIEILREHLFEHALSICKADEKFAVWGAQSLSHQIFNQLSLDEKKEFDDGDVFRSIGYIEIDAVKNALEKLKREDENG